MDELLQPVAAELRNSGYAFVEAGAMTAILERTGLEHRARAVTMRHDMRRRLDFLYKA